MNSRRLTIFGFIFVTLIIIGFIVVLMTGDIAILNPQGIIAEKQKELIIFTVALGMIVVIPVFIMLFFFAHKYRYREDDKRKKKTKYTPEVEGNRWLEVVWWGIPFAIIAILSVVTWVSTHELDPYKPLDSNKKPVNVQVVALQWKWLFIYPELGIASVNELRIPEKTPINFEVAADAPMSAFWIPELGSQIYAMNGMTSRLSLEANKAGVYRGTNTNISGEGYAEMNFETIASSQAEFDQWAKNLQSSTNHLTWKKYEALAEPSRKQPIIYYMLHETYLYDRILAKYMDHGSHESATMEEDMNHMHHEGHH